VAEFSGVELPGMETVESESAGEVKVRLITEGKIKERLLAAIGRCGKGCKVKMAMFYLSDQEVIKALLRAAQQGAEIKLLLDPNKDAFGRTKNGIPNRPLASYLVRKGRDRIQVRWYATHGEQFHSKLTMVSLPEESVIIGGSANLTHRNISDFNLETCLEIKAKPTSKISTEVNAYFDRIWQNKQGDFSQPFSLYEDNSRLRYWLTLFFEWSGISTF
jgi:phosphatidylserine/phosphatidylglycerophosphate/cardiolipin synthase-like enzyme